MSKSAKYFHELRPEEFSWLVAEGTTWGELERDFPQPPWCNYPNATNGKMGCWSLIAISEPYRITKKEACGECDCIRG